MDEIEKWLESVDYCGLPNTTKQPWLSLLFACGMAFKQPILERRNPSSNVWSLLIMKISKLETRRKIGDPSLHPSGSEKVYVKVLEVMALNDSKPKMDSNWSLFLKRSFLLCYGAQLTLMNTTLFKTLAPIYLAPRSILCSLNLYS